MLRSPKLAYQQLNGDLPPQPALKKKIVEHALMELKIYAVLEEDLLFCCPAAEEAMVAAVNGKRDSPIQGRKSEIPHAKKYGEITSSNSQPPGSRFGVLASRAF